MAIGNLKWTNYTKEYCLIISGLSKAISHQYYNTIPAISILESLAIFMFLFRAPLFVNNYINPLKKRHVEKLHKIVGRVGVAP